MKLVTFSMNGRDRLGALLDDRSVVDLAIAAHCIDASGPAFESMLALIEAGEPALDVARRAVKTCPDEAVIPAAAVKLRAPIPRPPRLRDTTMFLQHMINGLSKWAQTLAAKEADPAVALKALMASGKYTLKPIFYEQVMYYNADHLAISGPEDVIVWPEISEYADYELELGCVVGHSRRGISASSAKEAIFGYTIFNDWSARDLQMSVMEANLGPGAAKDFALSNSIGPCIVTRDELPNYRALSMKALVNGEIWSTGSTSTMQHGFEDAIAQFSRFEDLTPGEIIGSGTVATGCGFELGKRLSDGDVVELQIQSIGTLRNRVKLTAK